MKNKIISTAIAGMIGLSMVSSLGASATDTVLSDTVAVSDTTSNVVHEDFEVNNLSSNVISQITALYNFPCYQQPTGSNLCWAECARAIINYMLGTSYTDNDMITTVNYLKYYYNIGDYVGSDLSASDVSTFETIRYYLQPYNHGVTPANIPLVPSDVKFIIDRGMPIVMCLQNSLLLMGHMVVITGYGTAVTADPSAGISIGDITGVLYMDPITGTQNFAEFSPNGDVTITANGISYNWTKSCIIW